MSAMPGRHTWYNKQYNDLLCEANSIFGDEDKRNALYKQADASWSRMWGCADLPCHLYGDVKLDIAGPMLVPGKDGVVTWMRHRFSSRESLIYRTTNPGSNSAIRAQVAGANHR